MPSLELITYSILGSFVLLACEGAVIHDVGEVNTGGQTSTLVTNDTGGATNVAGGAASGGGSNPSVPGGAASVGGSNPNVPGGATSVGGSNPSGGAGAGGSNCAAQLPASILSRWIAFDSDREDYRRQIYRMHPDGSGLTRLLNDAYIDKEPVFSPDGARIAFTSSREGGTQVFLLEIASGAVTRVTNRSEAADQPSFSRDGTLIAFHSGASVHVVAPDGTGERLVATGLDTYNAYFWPQFSSNGSELVFDRNNEIDAVKMAGAGLRYIVHNWTTTIKAPAVSPNGQDVAYHVYCETPGTSIWTTPFATTTDPCKGRRVSPTGTYGCERPAWVTTSFISYEQVQLDTNIASIAIISRDAGSVPCIITPDTADNRNSSWSP